MAALRNSIQKAQQNVNDMRAKKKKTVQIPPRTSLPIPAADDPWAQAAEEEQLDWGLPDSPVAARTTDRIPIPAPRPHVQQAAQATTQPEHAPARQTAAQARSQPVPANQTAAHARPQHVPAPRQASQPDQRVAYYAAPAKLDPADYFHLPVQNLSHLQREQVKAIMKDSVYVTYDSFSKDQETNTPSNWVDHQRECFLLNGVNPDHAATYLSGAHLGPETAKAMTTWRFNNPGAGWENFRQAFLQANPGKPPKITRLTWKQLNMTTCGGYHAYLQEFNKQKAMISTGPDEVVETFLLGLSPTLRSQVEFFKNRNWRPGEFQELVDTTTERVNSTVIASTESNNKQSESSNKPFKRGRADKSNVVAGQAQSGPSRSTQTQTTAPNRPSRPQHLGRTKEESKAIAQFCYENGICKFCKNKGHTYQTCRAVQRPFRFPEGWDEQYWCRTNDSSLEFEISMLGRDQKTLSGSSTSGPVAM